MLEYWKNGMMEAWKNGMMEAWNAAFERSALFPHSNIPLFHYSIPLPC